jgi:CRP/FNR family transcriptional regulator, cyclic AMP receptor protein
MTGVDGLGFIAAGLVLATFCMKRLVRLRIMAIASNLAFILYGYAARIEPVLVLHLILLPVNLVRLAQVLPLSARHPAITTPFSPLSKNQRRVHRGCLGRQLRANTHSDPKRDCSREG